MPDFSRYIMYIPSVLIVLPCLACFALCAFRYYQLDPENRLTDRHFVTSFTALLTIVVYLIARIGWPDVWLLPVGFLLLALGLLGYAVWLFRRKPPAPEKPAQTLRMG